MEYSQSHSYGGQRRGLLGMFSSGELIFHYAEHVSVWTPLTTATELLLYLRSIPGHPVVVVGLGPTKAVSYMGLWVAPDYFVLEFTLLN